MSKVESVSALKSTTHAQQRVDVVFYGEIIDGFTLPTVKQGFGQLFALTDTKVEQIFAARKVTLKADLDQAVAAKYQQTLKRAGALVQLEPRPEVTPVSPVKVQPVSKPVATLIAGSTRAVANVDTTSESNPNAVAAAQPSTPAPLRRKLPSAEELSFGFKVKRWLGLV